MNPSDTVTHPPILPRFDPSNAVTRADVEAIIDARLQVYDSEQRRAAANLRIADVRQRVMTYGVSGLVGLAVGVGTTLLVQRARRGRGGAKP